MKKGDWYRQLFGRIRESIDKEFYFEAAFICYGIIEDRLTSVAKKEGLYKVDRTDDKGLEPFDGVNKKVKAIKKIRAERVKKAFKCKKWDGGKYKKSEVLDAAVDWGELYRNPMQHTLGDPRHYNASVGNYQTVNAKDLAEEGERVARDLAAGVMRWKKRKKQGL